MPGSGVWLHWLRTKSSVPPHLWSPVVRVKSARSGLLPVKIIPCRVCLIFLFFLVRQTVLVCGLELTVEFKRASIWWSCCPSLSLQPQANLSVSLNYFLYPNVERLYKLALFQLSIFPTWPWWLLVMGMQVWFWKARLGAGRWLSG